MIIRTTHGDVKGFTRGDTAVFCGIPYGAPCDGAARFLPPRPAQDWEGVLDCTRNGPIAVQNGGSISGSEGLGPYFSGGRPEDFGVKEERQDEKCLVLNVLSPDVGGKKPVLVYIHGGGFASGSGSLVVGAHRFVQEQDTVLVGVNHRLNVFGYLYLEHLDAKYAGSGMAGMLDLVLALEWVRDNIAAFGGDPAQVTVMGESGGGAKINTLLAMPQAEGLFCRAVVESGSMPAGTLLPEQAAALTEKLAKRLGMEKPDPAALAAVPAQQLLAAASDPALSFGPVADGANLAPNPAGSFAPQGFACSIPLLVGSSEDEMAVFTPQEKLRDITWENLAQKLADSGPRRGMAGVKGFTEENAPARIAVFRAADRKGDSPAHLYLKMVSMCGMLGGGAFHQAMAWAKSGAAPVYHYAVSYDAPLPDSGNMRCAWHTADLPLQLRVVLHPESEALSRRMAAALGAFVRSGSPATQELPWPAFEPQQRLTMVFDEECRVESDPWQALREQLS
ncbi:MAG: carboxylesterase/lipase family protein [Oscillospiraceae bacterium]|nr:carboxylesterase/lipase family protein [Oscillospiraceae bacterium]